MTWLRDVWRQASAQGPIVVAALMLAASALLSAVANIADERNEHASDRADRAQIERLDDQLDCRAAQKDELDRAIGRGLVAVAQDDSATLATQARRIIEIVDNEGDC
jgi:hypothetical protein